MEFVDNKNESVPTAGTDPFPYHSNSELSERNGYYPNLTADHLSALNSILELVRKHELQITEPHGKEHEKLKLLRFLRARKFDVDKAFEMLKNDVEWRSHDSRKNLRLQTAEQVLQCDLTEMYKYFPTWVQGYDKQHRPISWRQFGKFEIWNVLTLTSMENIVKFHAWESEQAIRLMEEQSIRTGYNIETFIIVVDAAGWGLRLATSDAYTFIKGMISTDSDHYPERLGMCIVINAPYALSFAWKVIAPFIDEVSKAKIKILGGSKDDWLPTLLEVMHIDQIPSQYGGTAADLPPEDALKSMNPPQQTESSDAKLDD